MQIRLLRKNTQDKKFLTWHVVQASINCRTHRDHLTLEFSSFFSSSVPHPSNSILSFLFPGSQILLFLHLWTWWSWTWCTWAPVNWYIFGSDMPSVLGLVINACHLWQEMTIINLCKKCQTRCCPHHLSPSIQGVV